MEFLGRDITDVTFESMLLQEGDRALSGRKWTSSTRAQWWRFLVQLQSSWHHAPQAAIRVFAHMAARNQSQQFDFPVPQPPGGNTLGGKRVAATAQGRVRVGLTGVGNPIIDVGRFIRFANHAKVYIVEDASPTTITLFPRLVTAVSASTAIDFTPAIVATYAGLARMGFQRGRATPTVIVEEVI